MYSCMCVVTYKNFINIVLYFCEHKDFQQEFEPEAVAHDQVVAVDDPAAMIAQPVDIPSSQPFQPSEEDLDLSNSSVSQR